MVAGGRAGIWSRGRQDLRSTAALVPTSERLDLLLVETEGLRFGDGAGRV